MAINSHKNLQRRLRALILTFAASCLAVSCGDDDEVNTEPQSPQPILFGVTQKSGGVEWADGKFETRAQDDVASTQLDNIGVFAYGDANNSTTIFRNQKVYFKNGKSIEDSGLNASDWKYQQYVVNQGDYVTENGVNIETPNLWPYATEDGVQRPWEKMKYKFFAYSPWYDGNDVLVTAGTYSDFKSFTWDNIPGFTGEDHVLSNVIVSVDNSNGNRKTEEAVHFRMSHILSRIRLFFELNEHYRELRKIQLDSLTVISAGRYKKATFSFNANNAWDGTANWSNEEYGDAEPVTLTNPETQYFIPTEFPAEPYTDIYVFPQTGFKELKLRLTYTVYDSKGVITREKVKVTNTVEIRGPEGNGWDLRSGYYYDIKITVAPSYLYVLSDNDEEFDGYVIIPDTSGS